jgi:hypothetical protein
MAVLPVISFTSEIVAALRGADMLATIASIRRLRPLVAIALFAGCGQPPREMLHPVQGRITFDGQPLPRGAVTLHPTSTETTWHQPTAMIEPAGRYVVYTNGRVGAPPGTYRAVVFASEATISPDGAARPGLPKSLIPNRYNQPDQTPLRLEVVAQPAANSYDLELSSHEK